MPKERSLNKGILERLFTAHKGEIMEVILRLLWHAGISPKEMQKLRRTY